MKPFTRCVVLAAALTAGALTGACASLLDAKVKSDESVVADASGTAAADGNTPTSAGNSNTTGANPNATSSNSNTNTTASSGNVMVDSSGCAVATVKYTGTVDTILQTKCNGCHNSRSPVMTNYAQAVAAWKTGGAQADVDNGSMPIGGFTLTAAQKCALTNWRTSGYGQ